MVTAQTTSKSSSLQRTLPALGVLVALVIALGAWLLPLSWLEPGSRAVFQRPTQGGAIEDIGWTRPEPRPWTELVEDIEELREPDREVEPTGVTPGPTPDNNDDMPAPVVRVVRPQWTYEGFIEEPGGLVAVLRTRAGQRLVFVGDTIVSDASGDTGTVFTVDEITTERLVIVFEENRFPYKMQRTATRPLPDRDGRPGRNGRGPLQPMPGVPPSSLPGEQQ